MSRTSVWSNEDALAGTIRQLAIDNGTPNVMPTLEQMSGTPGLVTWVRKKVGGVNKLANKLNMVVKPAVTPHSGVNERPLPRNILKGANVFVHNNSSVYPAIVIDSGIEPGSLIVLVFNKKMPRKHVQYGVVSSTRYQWCYAEDIPKSRITVAI